MKTSASARIAAAIHRRYGETVAVSEDLDLQRSDFGAFVRSKRYRLD